jgi:hypothetical protein
MFVAEVFTITKRWNQWKNAINEWIIVHNEYNGKEWGTVAYHGVDEP